MLQEFIGLNLFSRCVCLTWLRHGFLFKMRRKVAHARRRLIRWYYFWYGCTDKWCTLLANTNTVNEFHQHLSVSFAIRVNTFVFHKRCEKLIEISQIKYKILENQLETQVECYKFSKVNFIFLSKDQTHEILLFVTMVHAPSKCSFIIRLDDFPSLLAATWDHLVVIKVKEYAATGPGCYVESKLKKKFNLFFHIFIHLHPWAMDVWFFFYKIDKYYSFNLILFIPIIYDNWEPNY